MAALTSLFLGVSMPALADPVKATRVEVSLDGKSTVRDFSCRAKSALVQLTDAAAAEGAKLDQALLGATLAIAVTDLECGDNTMNDHLRNAMEAKKFKEIRFKVTAVTAEPKAEAFPVKLKGELTMHGQTLPAEVVMTGRPTANGVRLEGKHSVKMTEWGVKPPSLFFGTMNVRDTVVVKFDLTLPVVVTPAIAGNG
jgi:hypothetical protein